MKRINILSKISIKIFTLIIISLFIVSCAPVQPVEKTTYTKYKDKNLNFSLDYPSGVTFDLRHKIDVSRNIIEKTRGEISLAIQMNKLKRCLDK